MKKILNILIILTALLFSSQAYATDGEKGEVKTVIYVTEKVPGVGAKCVKEDKTNGGYVESTDGTCDKYEVTVERDFGSVTAIIKGIIKYFTLIAYLLGVLFIVLNGIMISISGIDSGIKETAKKRIVQTIMGLVVLSLSGLILTIVAPWIFS